MVGFNANMISYLTTQLHMPLTKAANTLTNFGGTASLTPLLGAFIADAYAGRFWTITIASIIYQIVRFSLSDSRKRYSSNFNFWPLAASMFELLSRILPRESKINSTLVYVNIKLANLPFLCIRSHYY